MRRGSAVSCLAGIRAWTTSGIQAINIFQRGFLFWHFPKQCKPPKHLNFKTLLGYTHRSSKKILFCSQNLFSWEELKWGNCTTLTNQFCIRIHLPLKLQLHEWTLIGLHSKPNSWVISFWKIETERSFKRSAKTWVPQKGMRHRGFRYADGIPGNTCIKNTNIFLGKKPTLLFLNKVFPCTMLQKGIVEDVIMCWTKIKAKRICFRRLRGQEQTS